METNSNIIQDIIQRYVTEGIFDRKPKKGWLNELLDEYNQDDIDLHTVSIKLGHSWEHISRDVAEINHTVPKCIAGYGVSETEASDYLLHYTKKNNKKGEKDTLILTRYKNLKSEASKFWDEKKSHRKKNKNWRLRNGKLADYREKLLPTLKTGSEINVFNVDLVLVENGIYKLCELRTTGDTDNKKSDSTVEGLISASIALGSKPSEIYLGIISNNRGFNKKLEWKGILGGYLAKELILIEEKWWEFLSLPITLDEFKEILKETLDKQYTKKVYNAEIKTA